VVRFCSFRNAENSRHGGDLASTWVLKQEEQTGAPEVLVKTGKMTVANDNFALAA